MFAPVEQARGRAIQRLIDEPAVGRALRRMVMRMEDNPDTREELLQEAWIHFWSTERRRPGQRLAWYLQGVQFHLRHLRTSGRSLDSPRHREAQVRVADSAHGRDAWPDMLGLDESIMSEVNAHDIFCLLTARLKPTDQKILSALVEGWGICEIAEKLHVPHMFVVRHRRQIGKLAIKLGVAPLRAGQLQRTPSGKAKPAA